MYTFRIPLFLLSLLLLGATATAQSRVSLVDSESRLWIEGRSTINEFTCKAGRLDGSASLDRDGSAAEVVVPVETFDCGKRPMNRDFYHALKSDRYPHIRFELSDAAINAQEGSAFDVQVEGRLTIAGVTRHVTLSSSGRRRPDGAFELTGRLPLSMRDFNIDPPTALAGLIRANERIVVAFDLVAEIEEENTAALCELDPRIFC